MQEVIKSIPFHVQVYDILKERILAGNPKPGERLYENKLSEELGVSRSPIREALRMLEQDELVVVTNGGMSVNPMGLADLEEVYQCRMAVEPFAARLASSRLSEEDLIELSNLIELAREHHSVQEYDKVVMCNTAFHDLIIRSCGNERLIGIIQRIDSLIKLSRSVEFQSYRRSDEYLVEHERLLEALQLKDGDLVEQVLREHIQNDFEFNRKCLDEKSEG